MYKIIDNFLEKDTFLKIKNILLSDEFPWYYTNVLESIPVNEEAQNYNFQFTHTFYKNYLPNSSAVSVIEPIVEKLNLKEIIRIKANLGTRTEKIVQHGFHIDYENCTTAIFYINSNNGQTVFENGDAVNSIENRLIIFNSNMSHTGTTCTDENVRCVINFNYIPRGSYAQ